MKTGGKKRNKKLKNSEQPKCRRSVWRFESLPMAIAIAIHRHTNHFPHLGKSDLPSKTGGSKKTLPMLTGSCRRNSFYRIIISMKYDFHMHGAYFTDKPTAQCDRPMTIRF